MFYIFILYSLLQISIPPGTNFTYKWCELGVKWVAATHIRLSFIFVFIFTLTHSTASFWFPLFICGTHSVLKEKLEVKMTKAFCKLQGFVFTILSSNMAFSPAACSFCFFFPSEKKRKGKKKIPQPNGSTEWKKKGHNYRRRWREREWVSIRNSHLLIFISLTWERGRLWSCLAEHVNSHSSNDYICQCQSVGPSMAFSDNLNPVTQANLNKTWL